MGDPRQVGIGALSSGILGMAGARSFNLKDLQNQRLGSVIRCNNPAEAQAQARERALSGQAAYHRESMNYPGVRIAITDSGMKKKLSIREKLQEEINEWLKEFKK